MPDVGTPAHEIERPRHGAVNEVMAGSGAMTAVVPDIKANAGHGKAKRNRQRYRLPPCRGDEDEEHVSPKEPAQQQTDLDIQCRIITRRLPVVAKYVSTRDLSTV
jgi:hypothetical protein